MRYFDTDEEFFAAIDAADPDTFGISCSVCETYYVGKITLFSYDDRDKYCCPYCGSNQGSMESPALGAGPKAVQFSKLDRDGGEEVLQNLYVSQDYIFAQHFDS